MKARNNQPIYSMFIGVDVDCGVDGEYRTVTVGLSNSYIRLARRMIKVLADVAQDAHPYGYKATPHLSIYNVSLGGCYRK